MPNSIGKTQALIIVLICITGLTILITPAQDSIRKWLAEFFVMLCTWIMAMESLLNLFGPARPRPVAYNRRTGCLKQSIRVLSAICIVFTILHVEVLRKWATDIVKLSHSGLVHLQDDRGRNPGQGSIIASLERFVPMAVTQAEKPSGAVDDTRNDTSDTVSISPQEPTERPISTTATVSSVQGLIIRERPTRQSAKLEVIPAGKRVEVFCEQPIIADGLTWVHVRHNRNEGYMSREYLRVNTGCAN